MKMKMAVASLLLVSMQAASADLLYWNPNNFYYQYYSGAPEEEYNLAYTKALRDKARKEREETGKSDVGARIRLEEECARAIERGVEDGVRRSYGCGQSSYVPSVQQQPAGPKVIYPPSSARERTDQ